MPTYIYETTDSKKPIRRFEIQQSMKDEPLRAHPETGEPVRRIISGGIGVMVGGKASPPPKRSCGPGCGCH